MSVPGRSRSIEVIYSEPKIDYLEAAIKIVIYEIHTKEKEGDILLFLTDQEEVEEACRRRNGYIDHMAEVGELQCIPLYSPLPPDLMHKFSEFAPLMMKHGKHGRKCFVATNIAETSLTIKGVVYVVDPGFSVQKMYDPRTVMELLSVAPISKACAVQRAERADQTQAAKCFRLYTENYYEQKLEAETIPEILRSNLVSVVLELKKMGVDLVRFDFISPPATETMTKALEILYYLEALDVDGNLTATGLQMAEFPIDPQLSKALLASHDLNCSDAILSIAAVIHCLYYTFSFLLVPNCFIQSYNAEKEADEAKMEFIDPTSDHLTLLNVFNKFGRIEEKDQKQWCCRNFINYRSMEKAFKIYMQLKQIMDRLHLPRPSKITNDAWSVNVCKALLYGFFMQVAHKKECTAEYSTLKENVTFQLHPSKVLKDCPEWVMYNECILTKTPYIRTVTSVEPEWFLEIAPQYFNTKNFPEGEVNKQLVKLLSK